jgi:penicillin-binding protein 2
MDKISNTASENKIFSTRLILALVFIVILTFILISKLYNLQISNYDYYTEESLGNQMRMLPITPIRGKIFDRNGKMIAGNQLAYKLTLTPEKTKNVSETLLLLKKYNFIDDKDIGIFNKNKKQYKKFHSIPLKYKLSEKQVAKFLVNNQFIGVDIESYFQRIYPYNDSSVHVTGYVSRMNKKDKAFYNKKDYLGTSFVGKVGIEKQYESLLHGKNGRKQIERNVTGRVINTKIIQKAQKGSDLYLSIDLDLHLPYLQKKCLNSLFYYRRLCLFCSFWRHSQLHERWSRCKDKFFENKTQCQPQ